MEKYLELLGRIKKSYSGKLYQDQLEKIEQFIKGEITPEELYQGESKNMDGIIYWTINHILNHEDKSVKYYIELPQDRYFNTLNAPCIIASKEEEISVQHDHMRAIGPNHIATKFPTFYGDMYHIEITGDFSSIPEGAMLYHSDWFKIMSKYPQLEERMVALTRSEDKSATVESVQEKIRTVMERYHNAPQNGEPNVFWVGKEEAQYLQQEVIDSIEFVVPKKYITYDQVLDRTFGTFEEIKNGISHQKETEPQTTTKKV